MGKYIEDSRQLLRLVGEKENILALSHCMTRLRFVLKDSAKADIAAIEAMEVVKGSFTQAGQFQVIIGKDINEFFHDFTQVSGIDGVLEEIPEQIARQKQNIFQKIAAAFSKNSRKNKWDR